VILPICVKAQTYQVVNSWRYVPVDATFWGKVQELKLKKDSKKIFEIAQEKQKNAKSDLEKQKRSMPMRRLA